MCAYLATVQLNQFRGKLSVKWAIDDQLTIQPILGCVYKCNSWTLHNTITMLGWATVQSNQGWLFEKKGFWYGGRLCISAIYKSVRTSLEVEVDTHPSKYISN